MPATRRRSTANRVTRRRFQTVVARPLGAGRAKARSLARRRRSLAPMATLAGMIGLAVTAVVAASAVLAALAGTYLAGLVLGAGMVGIAWIVSRSRRQAAVRRLGSPGRSRTLDCRRSRWDRPVAFRGEPHPPAPADRRVRPCPGSRRP